MPFIAPQQGLQLASGPAGGVHGAAGCRVPCCTLRPRPAIGNPDLACSSSIHPSRPRPPARPLAPALGCLSRPAEQTPRYVQICRDKLLYDTAPVGQQRCGVLAVSLASMLCPRQQGVAQAEWHSDCGIAVATLQQRRHKPKRCIKVLRSHHVGHQECPGHAGGVLQGTPDHLFRKEKIVRVHRTQRPASTAGDSAAREHSSCKGRRLGGCRVTRQLHRCPKAG